MIWIHSFTFCLQYDSTDDDLSSFVSSISILLMTLGAVMLISEAQAVRTEDGSEDVSGIDSFFAAFYMVSLTCCCMLFELTMTFFSTDTGSRFRNNCPRTCRDESYERRDTSRDDLVVSAGPCKVVPVRPSAVSQEDQRRGADALQKVREEFGADSPEYKAKLKSIQETTASGKTN